MAVSGVTDYRQLPGAIDYEKMYEQQRLWAEENFANGTKSARNDANDMKTQFLTLLVAQLKNQDPMNPVENQDFVAQLAQFSSLEQLITINESVEKLTGSSSKINEGMEKLTGSDSKLNYIGEGVDYIASLLTHVALPDSSGAADGKEPPKE